MDCQPSLHLISSLETFTPTSQVLATTPPIHPFTSPFLAKSLAEIAEILRSSIAGNAFNTIDPNLFAVLDENSVSEDSGLIVQVKDGVVDCVRVHFDTVNAELIRIQMITFDIEETKGLVGKDGVFRTKPPQENRKGGWAVRKMLGAG
jgi:hypothetical protein